MDITWVGSPNHFNGRDGARVTHITLHVMAGYLAGTDSVFNNPGLQTSATYGIGGNGEIHQYVDEKNGPWSDANYNSNMTTISIEHQGGLDFIPCTRACLDASAALCADISRRYNLGRLWHDGTRGNVWLHREIPGSDHATCPDIAPNGVNVDYIINKANQLLANGGTDMALDQSELNAIAGAVWGYNYKNTATGGNMYNTIGYMLSKVRSMPADVWSYNWKDGKTGKGGQPGGNMYNSIATLQAKLDRALQDTAVNAAKLEAMNTAMETVVKAVGANPQDIGAIVDKAVRDKLATIKLTVQEGN